MKNLGKETKMLISVYDFLACITQLAFYYKVYNLKFSNLIMTYSAL